MSIGQQPPPVVVHKSNAIPIIIAAIIGAGTYIAVEKSKPAPVIVNPGPFDPDVDPSPAEVTGGEEIGETFIVNYSRGLSRNSTKLMADLGSGMDEREAVDAAKQANKQTRIDESKRIEDFLRQFKGNPKKMAIAAGQLADGYKQAVKGK